MQFEDFDNKVKEAADHYYPAYDEKAWSKMENLLNKHMPQKKDDRRRFFFFILLSILLLGGGSWLFFSKPWQNDQPLAEKIAPVSRPVTGDPISTKDAHEEKSQTVIIPEIPESRDANLLTVPVTNNRITGNPVSGQNKPKVDPLNLTGKRSINSENIIDTRRSTVADLNKTVVTETKTSSPEELPASTRVVITVQDKLTDQKTISNPE